MTARLDEPVARQGRSRNLALIAAAFLFTAPWVVLNAQGAHPEPLAVAAISGLAILGAAILLSWAAEVLQMDISQALALALLALIAVLPVDAVDAVFAFEAGRDPVVAQEGYAVANMTGANRLLIGLGWSPSAPSVTTSAPVGTSSPSRRTASSAPTASGRGARPSDSRQRPERVSDAAPAWPPPVDRG